MLYLHKFHHANPYNIYFKLATARNSSGSTTTSMVGCGMIMVWYWLIVWLWSGVGHGVVMVWCGMVWYYDMGHETGRSDSGSGSLGRWIEVLFFRQTTQTKPLHPAPTSLNSCKLFTVGWVVMVAPGLAYCCCYPLVLMGLRAPYIFLSVRLFILLSCPAGAVNHRQNKGDIGF